MFQGAHGTLDFSLDSEIIIVEGRGPWNKEAMLEAQETMNKLHEQRSTDKWGLIAILSGDALLTPDAVASLVDSIAKGKKHGRMATAIIFKDSTSPTFGRIHIAETCEQAGESFQFFDEFTEAKAWVNSMIY